MNRHFVILLSFVVVLVSSVQGYNVSSNQVSVSGISSGGYMAVQYQISFSESIMGVGVVAGGPYWCANDNLVTATTACMETPDLIVVTELVSATSFAYNTKSIDSPGNIGKSKLFLFSGTLDSVVKTGVVKKTASYYSNYMQSSQMTQVYNIPAEHSFPTNNASFPNCNYLGSPYINNCGYDGAGELLQAIYGTLKTPVSFNYQNLVHLDQTSFVPHGWSASKASLYSSAYAYVPTGCASNQLQCSLHVAFHGCEQTIPEIGDLFYAYAGYNSWAEANNIIILYPQAEISDLIPYNPDGCWDWWGYTSSAYATQVAPQILTVQAMIQYLMQEE
eukprot:TRINITY_DN5827_c0_g2_i1.p1 TRINITY_DN5827_c0_g2~~TRINITY_DN5827_c0_g2_i1.p1  ORF type:complete len:361 (+),score=25.56 TRINITY_DN5827_c0_g2_i1:86-1084(+)